MPQLAIVSAADSNYFPLLRDLVESIQDKPQGRAVPLHILDAGLAPPELAWLKQRRIAAVPLAWPYSIAVPGPQQALALRCRIPMMIPGYVSYLWLDSDTWVQDWAAIELYRRSAEEWKFCIAAEADRSFDLGDVAAWNAGTCERLYGRHLAQRIAGKPLLNAGVFAARADAPHWRRWRYWVDQALIASGADFFLDQTALNLVAYVDGLEMAVLPAHNNWTCHRALPRATKDGRKLLDPQPPHQPLGIVHMTHVTKQWRFVLRTVGGGLVLRSLRYRGEPVPAADSRDPIAPEIELASADALTRRRHDAAALLRRLAARHPTHARTLAALGEVAMQRGDLGEAARMLRRAAALRPGDGSLQAQLGAAYLRQGRAEEAATAFGQALATQPTEEIRLQLDRAVEAQVMPAGDHVSPGLIRVRPDLHFPHMTREERAGQNCYFDRRFPEPAFVTRDEAHIMFNTALRLQSGCALDVGAFLGFSTCHLALGELSVDAIDSRLADRRILSSTMDSLASAGVLDSCRLIADDGPTAIETLGQEGRRWCLACFAGGTPVLSLIRACEPHLEANAILLLHDARTPEVAAALRALRGAGWQVGIYRTSRGLGIAWRGAAEPCAHTPDPALAAAAGSGTGPEVLI
jgi:tetratricopeptide (TPR) repeat protein